MDLRYLLLLCLLPAFTSGQQLNEKNFDHYYTDHGLSHNYVTGIAQDSTGYVWIGTASGVNRFNGTRFVQFHSSIDSLSMASEEVTGMTWLDKYRLGIFTTGLHIINTRTGATHNIFIPYHDSRYQFKFNMVMRAMGDANGNTYVLTRSGFYHYDKDYNLAFRFDYYKEKDVPLMHFYFGRDLFEMDEKRLLIGSIDGLYVYDKQAKQIKKMTAQDCPALANAVNYPDDYIKFFEAGRYQLFIMKMGGDSIFYVNTAANKIVGSRVPFKIEYDEIHYRSRLLKLNDTSFYLTSHKAGFYKLGLDPKNGAIKMYPEKYFPSYLCTGLLKDKEGHLWVATNRGLFRENPQKAIVQLGKLPQDIENTYPDIKMDDIYVLGDKIYAGTRDAGVFIFDKKTMELKEQVPLNYADNTGSIRAITDMGTETLMLGTEGPVILFDVASRRSRKLMPPGWKSGHWTSDLYKDRNGNIWISSFNIYKYDPVTNKFTIIPYPENFPIVPVGIQGDTAGNIWIAGHGLARYNAKLNKYDILLDSFPAIKIMDKQVGAPVTDRRNTLWFSSNNNGVIGYDPITKQFMQFSRGNGLPDDNIASLIIVNDRLWIACYSGIACLDLNTYQIMSFGKEDGFPDMPIVKGARFFYDQQLKQLYIGFSEAVARFNPEDMLKKKTPPQTFIENLSIGGVKNVFLPGQQLTTSWQDNDIRVNIGTINFSDGAVQRFAYRIVKDSNTAWVPLGSQASFSISNLSPGTHHIQVKAFAPNNRWPEQVHELSLVVLPPLWKKDWFIGIMSALVLVLLYLLIKWRTGLARRNEMEKTHTEKIKADHYKNQFELEQISNYFSSSLAGKKTADDVLWDVARNLIGRMNYEDCIIYLWNEDKTRMVQKAAYGPKGKPEAITEQLFDVLPGQGIVGHVVKTQRPVIVNDTRKEPRYRVDDQFRLSEVCVPIIHNGELLGVIDSEHHLPDYFSERDIKILTTIATLIANKLKQLASEQKLDDKRKELANINEQLAEARLSALQAQMNPHFVFNALNSIKRMILDSDNEKASRYLSKFALMIRMTLNHSKELFVTLDENIAYLKAYLEMEQLRFDDSFTYSIYTGDNIDASETPIPSMMIQPLVENAIWHGLMQAESDKKLRIKFTELNNKITCTVEDNGIGIRQSEKLKEQNRPTHQSVGLENLQKRIKIMNEKYDMDCSLQITDLKETGVNGSGTRVVLKFNMINV